MENNRIETLNYLLENGLKHDPDGIALKKGDNIFSYSYLDRKSNRLALLLRDKYGVDIGDRVVVIADKHPEIVVSAIGIWKSGGVYVPVDVKNPGKRLEYILDKVNPAVVISSLDKLEEMADVIGSIPCISYRDIQALSGIDAFEMPQISPEDDGIIIHTSGSTGAPKGAILTHGSVTTYFRNHNRVMKFDEASVGMNNGPFHFDVSVQDTFLPLFFGARVIMHDDLFISRIMLPLMKREGVTHLIAVSSVLDLISQDDEYLKSMGDNAPRTVITGGEICDVQLINKWLSYYPDVNLNYGYGPTECNSLCMSYQVKEKEANRSAPFPIGKMFPEHTAILLDDNEEVIQECDVVGVLAISGPQLMRGYWENQEETDRVFRTIHGKKYYVTGDRCWRDGDGNYHFSGRQDTEVKILGRRINLMEVRNALLAHKHVKYAVVDTVVVRDETRIFGYVQSLDTDSSILDLLDDFVAERLPVYMRPWYLCRSDQVHKTSTGKINERLIKEQVRDKIAGAPDVAHFNLPT